MRIAKIIFIIKKECSEEDDNENSGTIDEETDLGSDKNKGTGKEENTSVTKRKQMNSI